eukprot:15180-Prymnesium_polylepis.1
MARGIGPRRVVSSWHHICRAVTKSFSGGRLGELPLLQREVPSACAIHGTRQTAVLTCLLDPLADGRWWRPGAVSGATRPGGASGMRYVSMPPSRGGRWPMVAPGGGIERYAAL